MRRKPFFLARISRGAILGPSPRSHWSHVDCPPLYDLREDIMAFAEKRGDWFRIVFRFGGTRYRHTLKTNDAEVADSVAGGVKRTLMLLEQRALRIPEGGDVLSFVLSGGQILNAPQTSGHEND